MRWKRNTLVAPSTRFLMAPHCRQVFPRRMCRAVNPHSFPQKSASEYLGMRQQGNNPLAGESIFFPLRNSVLHTAV